jgi:hypothetical protein
LESFLKPKGGLKPTAFKRPADRQQPNESTQNNGKGGRQERYREIEGQKDRENEAEQRRWIKECVFSIFYRRKI